MAEKQLVLPIFKSSIGSLDWHLPILLKTIGKERIRTIRDVNIELPGSFLKKLQERDSEQNRKPISHIKDRGTLEYTGFSYDGRKASKRYLIVQLYSLAIPSGINLGLISQQSPHEMLTFLGRRLLKSLEDNNPNSILKSDDSLNVFRKILLWRDRKWKIIPSINEISNDVSSDSILSQLERHGVIVYVSKKKLYKRTRMELISSLRKEGKIRDGRDTIRLANQINQKIKKQIEEENNCGSVF